MADSPLAAIQDKRQLFATLKQHPAWPQLLDHYKELRVRYERQLGARLMGGAELDQREVDFHRGYWHGVFAVLASPEAAEQAWMSAELKASRGKGVSERVGNGA